MESLISQDNILQLSVLGEEIRCMRLVVPAYVSLRTGRPKKALKIADGGWEKLSMIARPQGLHTDHGDARGSSSVVGRGESNSAVARRLSASGGNGSESLGWTA